MDPSMSGPALAALGEDLFVLSIRPRDGELLIRGRIDAALMASELIRLAAAGRAQIAKGRIAVRDRTPTGDGELDAALLSLAGAAFPPRPEAWVGLPRPGIRHAYATRLISACVLRMGSSRLRVRRATRSSTPRGWPWPGPGWMLSRTLPGRRAISPRRPWPGLASAIGLSTALYPGREGRTRRARMARIARQQVIAHAAARRGGGRGPRWSPLARSLAQRIRRRPAKLLREPGSGAGGDPALAASIEEAVAAAVHAVTAVIEGGAAFSSQVLGAVRPARPRGGRPRRGRPP